VGDNNYTLSRWWSFAPPQTGFIPQIQEIITGNIDGDGFEEIVVAINHLELTSELDITDMIGSIHIYENSMHIENGTHVNNGFSGRFAQNYNFDGVFSVAAGNMDEDQFLEVYLGTSSGVQIIEPSSDNVYVEYIDHMETDDPVYAVAFGNTDGDSWEEVIVGAGKHVIIFEQNQLTVPVTLLDYDEVWKSYELHEDVTDIAIGNTNNDEQLEIFVTAQKGYLYTFEHILDPRQIDPGALFYLSSEDVPVISETVQEDQISVIPLYRFYEKTRRLLFL
jgi:hypothetical protein